MTIIQIPAVNPYIHFASLEQYNTVLHVNSIPPSLFTTLSAFPNCYPFIMFPPHHFIILPPFSFCHLTPLTQLSHLTTSLQSYTFPPSQLTILPSFPAHPLAKTNRNLQNSNLLPLRKQGKHVSLMARWSLIMADGCSAGWWDAPLELWDLAEAISITEGSHYQKLKICPPGKRSRIAVTGVCLAVH